ncbi:hypothetical protein [Wielerella bovis]|uniref:hypothetical protein n=1 Tax=Wielerella bovis TaxID=2917790 RepID=UPI002018A642|nr:hypothetical protein [Wielerella bovis]MCG7657159.1 hypothetical protein [Wielerella bovis]MCG7659382.1 hypothetical protein [Wielerella bovis]
MKRPNPKQILSHSIALFSGCLIAISAPVGAWHSTHEPIYAVSHHVQLRTFDCETQQDIPLEWYLNQDITPALQRLNNGCENERNMLMLAKIWATDPMAGVVYE